MTRLRTLAALLGLAALAACDKNAVQVIAGPEAGARIKFYNFGINAPAVNFYAGDVKMTAINSTTGTESTNGVAYGSVGAGALYTSIPPGPYTITGRIAAATDKDLVISTLDATLADGMAYSFYMTGFYDAVGKVSDDFIVEDDLPDFDFENAYVRFVHGSPNAAPLTLFATNTVGGAVVQVGDEVTFKGAGAFTVVPPGTYNLGARLTGVPTNAVARTNVSFAAGRVYTISLRGDITITSTTAVNRPFLDNTLNR